MALQSNAALLDELMGKNRNIAPGACINQVKFDDEDVSWKIIYYMIIKNLGKQKNYILFK